jgi:hypothetical protein
MPETRPPLDIARSSLREVEAALASRSRPPVERWNPPHCGHSGMRIDREGRWWHEGRQIEREALVRLFASVLRREEDGSHLLVTPAEKLDIDVEWTALRVTAMTCEGEGAAANIAFQLSDGGAIVLGPEYPLIISHGLPIVRVHGGLEASFERPVYFELAELALGNDPPGIWSGGCFFPMASE